MTNTLQSLLCRHTWYWSERHGTDRCRRCGKLSSEGSAPTFAAAPAVQAPSTLAVQPTVGVSPTLAASPAVEDPPTPAVAPPVEVSPTFAVSPGVEVSSSAARPAGPRPLRGRLDALALDGDLSRDEILLTVIELIEDAQTARPQLDGAAAAHYFAVLNSARRQLA
ncbi:hypothetical protein [Brevundimonas sp.]|uniref:hypothetical protein n=1 Tax=Brevundimonas sp. TaxID=1871086 RepID=UPI0026177DD5|nr:hypothetical protein [Brevundimonas sp.]